MSNLSPEPHLELSLLGAPEVRLNGQSIICGPTKKTQALLFYLATTQQIHHREKLAAIFWPDAPIDRARKNLRDALFHLRKQFDPFLTTTPHNIAFAHTNNFTFDVQLFRSEFGKPAAGVPGERRTIANLYRGEFLQGFSLHDAPRFDDWVSIERESYHQLAVQGLVQLLPHTLIHDPIQDGLALCNQLLLMEPWNEEALLAKLRLLNRSGQRLAAIQQYHAYYTLLEAEFGVEPAEPIQAYYDQMMAGISPSNSLLPQNSQRRRQHDTISISNNLQPPQGSFIGRQKEIAQLLAHLYEQDTQLLTIVGLGGMGKTKLAQQVAHLALKRENESLMAGGSTRFSDGIYYVPLASVYSHSDAPDDLLPQPPSLNELLLQSVVTTIAEAIGLRIFGQVPPLEQLRLHILEQKLLLILDNFEHLTGTASVIDQLVEQAPNLRLVVTSRQRLSLRNEQLLELHGLSWQSEQIPRSVLSNNSGHAHPAHAQIAYAQTGYREIQPKREVHVTSDAMNLFIRSAQLVDDRLVHGYSQTDHPLSLPGSEEIAEQPIESVDEDEKIMAPIRQICRLVEGMPLAIELAASLARTTPIQDIAKILAKDYDILQSKLYGLNEGHQSIRLMLDTSWRTLTPIERQVLARLTLFRGGFTVPAAKAVAAATEKILSRLVDKSFIHLVDGKIVNDQIVDGRYNMHILIRRYAAEQLNINSRLDINAIQGRFYEYYSDFLQEQMSAWQSTCQQSTIVLLQKEVDNLATTWELLSSSDNLRLRLSYIDDLWLFYKTSSRLTEALTIAKEGLTTLRRDMVGASNAKMIASAKLLWYMSEAYFELGQLQKSNQYAWHALNELGYTRPRSSYHQFLALGVGFGKQLIRRQRAKTSTVNSTHEKESLAARAYFRLQINSYFNDKPTDLFTYGLRFVELADKVSDPSLQALAYGQMSLLSGTVRMKRLAERYISLADQIILDADGQYTAIDLPDQITMAKCIGLYNVSCGQTAEAEERFAHAYELCIKIGDLSNVGDCIVMLHSLALRRGNLDQSMTYAAVLESYAQINHNAAHTGWSLIILAISNIEAGKANIASHLLKQAMPFTKKMMMGDLGHATGASAMALASFRIRDYRNAKYMADSVLASLENSRLSSTYYLFCIASLLEVYSNLWELALRHPKQHLPDDGILAPKEYRRVTDKMIRMLVRFSWQHPIAKPYINLYRGRHLLHRGYGADAIFMWQAGLADAKAQLNLPLVARLRYEIGRTLTYSSSLGAEYLEKARDSFAEYKMHYDLELVNRAIRDGGASTEKDHLQEDESRRQFRLEPHSAPISDRLD